MLGGRRSDSLSDPSAVADVEAFLEAARSGRVVSLATSGTSSGTPAGRRVLRTTGSWTSSFPAVSELVGLTSASRVWVPGPLSATMNLFAAVHAVWCGATLADRVEAATHAQLTPAALHRLLGQDVSLAGLTVVVAGDRLDRTLRDRAVAAGARVHHYYGAAELSFVAWGPDADDLRPFPEVDVQIRSGVVWVRSPYLCLGYDAPHDRPYDRAGPLRRDGDGWATVGDRAVLEEGRLRVLGRPDAVVVAGETVEPAEVESVLRPGGAGEVLVVGVAHAVLGTVLAVALTEVSDHAPLVATARARLLGARRPRLWYVLDDLPLTAAGKVDRAEVARWLGAGDEHARRLAPEATH